MKYGVCAMHVGLLGIQITTLTHYTFLIQGKNFRPNTSQCFFLRKSSEFLKFPNKNILAQINIFLILNESVAQVET